MSLWISQCGVHSNPKALFLLSLSSLSPSSHSHPNLKPYSCFLFLPLFLPFSPFLTWKPYSCNIILSPLFPLPSILSWKPYSCNLFLFLYPSAHSSFCPWHHAIQVSPNIAVINSIIIKQDSLIQCSSRVNWRCLVRTSCRYTGFLDRLLVDLLSPYRQILGYYIDYAMIISFQINSSSSFYKCPLFRCCTL